MTPTLQQREQRYGAAPPEVQELYASEHVGAILQSIFDAHQLRTELYKEYVNVFGDVVLGFEKKENMTRLFEERLNIPEHLADVFARELNEKLLSTVNLPSDVLANDNAEHTENTSENVTPMNVDQAPTDLPVYGYRNNNPDNPPVPAEIKQPVVEPLNIEPKQAEHEQVPLPSYSKPLTNTPPPSDDDPYREPIE